MVKVLSLFDGLGGARVALNKAGFEVEAYFRAEIDDAANKTYWYNWHNRYEQQCAKFVNYRDVTRNDFDFPSGYIDLLIAGPPCQSFSMSGKGAGFDDPRGQLMLLTADLVKKVQPKYFLIENVAMKNEWKHEIDDLFQVYGLLLDSSLFSPQRRRRYYWTDIPFTTPKQGTGAKIMDILQHPDDEWNGEVVNGKADISGGNRQQCQVDHAQSSSRTLTANSRAGGQIKVTLDGKTWRALSAIELERLQGFPDDYTKLSGSYFGDRLFYPQLNSKTTRIRLLGNAFQCDTIAHILKGMQL